ncbi:MAG: hypothetical protein LBS31_04575 [Candidatus Adiutrix sp.]|jgi:hypothetical protein|nr:hypothetical protein [Candidatus Adiutrix sp.]
MSAESVKKRAEAGPDHPAGAALARPGGAGGDWKRVRLALSLLSWPEPDCPRALKPVMALLSAGLWLTLMVAATVQAQALSFLPLYPTGLIIMVTGFYGGSLIAVIVAMAYLTLISSGWLLPDLTEIGRALISSGYHYRDYIIFFIFAWLYGVPHWRKKYSGFFTVAWGLFVVAAPMAYIFLKAYPLYGHVPDKILERFAGQGVMLRWLLTVAAAAAVAKMMYALKDALRRRLA